MVVRKNCLRRALSASIQRRKLMPQTPSPLTPPTFPLLRIDVKRQILELFGEHGIEDLYPVSTSKFGLGFEEGSFRTPTGKFRIAEKIGENAPSGMIFRSRVATGTISPQGGDDDLVLSRILWLDGLEPENANTRERYIYIHGTNQEHLVGTPASHGCIRLKNVDMIDLFERVSAGTAVEIIG
jgi:lipoprotein-anchoring transpeptidase ErfK/SrfK